MNEAVAVAKEADTKKESSRVKSDVSTHRVQDEPERQLGSLSSVINNIRCDGGKPSVESIATKMSGMSTGERAPALLALQQTHGNQYVQRVVSGIQAKLVVGQPRDIYEQEADRVADEVMRMPEPRVQRQVDEEGEELIQTKALSERITPLVQRQKEEEEEEEIQTKPSPSQTSEVVSDVETNINSIRGGGQPLPGSTRAFFEPRFGQDFSQVRVHTDAKAAESARAVNARAFTAGRNVVFGAGQYAPGTSEGRRLMAHELTHVIQQQHSSNSATINRYPRGALEEWAIAKGKKSDAKTESGVKICYVPLAAFPKWLPSWASPVDHVFIEFDDWSAGFTWREGESEKDARIIPPEPRRNDSRKTCYNAERKDSEECRAKSSTEIKSCIQTEARKDPGRYHVIRNNCGDWVKRTFNNCCLKPKTPGHIY